MYFRWKPYVPAAARRQMAATDGRENEKEGAVALAQSPRAAARLRNRSGVRRGAANLERYSDYSNRLPRGSTYLRNGSVIDLKIGPGEVTAQVMGSDLYRIKVSIRAVAVAHWQGDCP